MGGVRKTAVYQAPLPRATPVCLWTNKGFGGSYPFNLTLGGVQAQSCVDFAKRPDSRIWLQRDENASLTQGQSPLIGPPL